MKRLSGLAGIAGLLLLAIWLGACSDSKPQLPLLSADAVILAFGDSLTFGTGGEAGMDYPSQLSKMIAKPVIMSVRPVIRLPEP